MMGVYMSSGIALSNRKIGALIGGLAVLGVSGGAARAQDYQNLVSAGAYLIRFNGDSSQLAGPFTPPGVEVRPEDTKAVAFTYTRFLSGGWALTGAFGVPPRYRLDGAGTIAGAGELGSARAVAPTLLLEKHKSLPGTPISAFVGAGVTRTWFTGKRGTPTLDAALGGATAVDIENRWSPTFEAGVDYDLTRRYVASFVFGYSRLRSNVSLSTDTPGVGPIARDINVKFDPFVYRFSLGYRF